MNARKVELISIKEYTATQSEYDVVGKLPNRSTSLCPFGSGKTVLLQNLILDIYRDLLSRVVILSPSIDVDSSWLLVKKKIEKEMKVQRTDEDPIYCDHFDPHAVHEILDSQTRSPTS